MAEDEEDSVVIPGDFLCPLTGEVMVYPVTAEDGHSYEQSAIERWFTLGNFTSPKTHAACRSQSLIPDETLGEAIVDFMKDMPRCFWNRRELRAWKTMLHELCQAWTCTSTETPEASVQCLFSQRSSIIGRSWTLMTNSESILSCSGLPARSGWLQKRSRYLHQWRKRWITLGQIALQSFKSTAEDAIATEAVELCCIVGAHVLPDQAKPGCIICIRLDYRRDILLSADSPSDAAEWSTAIQLAAAEARRRAKRQMCKQVLTRGMLVA